MMTFSFQRDEGVKVGFKRLFAEGLREAIRELGDPSLKRSEKVHRARRHGKQMRSLLRLAKSGLGDQFRQQDCWLRDTSRLLSNLRDAKTMLDTYCELRGIELITPEQLSSDDVLSELHRHRKGVLSQKRLVDKKLTTVAKRLEIALQGSNKMLLHGKGGQVLRRGLFGTYRENVRARRLAIDESSATSFHEWRKHVKYHLHHCQLIAPAWPRMLNARVEEVNELGGLLGKEHDLTILSDRCEQMPDTVDREAIRSVMDSVDERKRELQASAIALGKRLFQESPRAFSRRHVAYLRIWRE